MLDIQAEQQESGQPYQELYEAVAGLKRRHRLPTSIIRPRDGLALRNDAERETVQELVARFRRLPEDARRKLPALWNSLAQLEIVVGDLEAGQRDFQEVARLVRDPGSRAAAHHNVYRTALERRDWEAALSALRKAVALDALAFEPFPWARYEPRRILGADGFGVSFSCHDKTKGEDVVVESLDPDGLDRPDSMIFREWRTLQDLEQPTLVRVFDAAYAGPESSRPFVVLEPIDATPLDDYVAAHGPFSPDDWLEVCYPIARAIQAMHGKGVLHRSLRPACVLLRYTKTRDGVRRPVVKLADTGLSLSRKVLHANAGNPEAAAQTCVGRSVTRMVGYLAPEVIGRPKGHVWVGPHSDIYALGQLCLFAMTGRVDAGIAEMHRLTDDWHKLLDHCTAWTINRRPASMDLVMTALEALAPQGFVHDMERDHQEATVAAHSVTIADDPDNVAARSHRGIAYLRQGEFALAVADLTEALRRAPGDASLYRRRAQARQKLGEHAAAILDYTESLRVDPRNTEALTSRGLAQVAAGEHDLAIMDFTEAIKLAPRDEALFAHRGSAYFVKGDIERAIADYSQSLRLDPRNASALGNRGRAFLLRGETARAVEDFSRLLQIDPSSLKALADRAGAFMDLGKADRAIADYTEAIRLAPTSSLYHDRGIAHAIADKLDAAVGDFGEALALDPENVGSLLSRGDALARQDHLDRAAADFTEAIRIEPRGPTAHVRRAGVLARLRRFDEALADLATVMRIDPRGSSAYLQRARLFMDRGDFALALADLTDVIRLDGRSIVAHLRRAECHTRLGDTEKALADFDQALAFDAINVAALTGRADLRLKVGQIDGTLADLTDLARLEPQVAKTFVTRGLLFASQGEEDSALADLDQAVRLDPEDSTLHAHRGNLRAARGEPDRAIADLSEATRLDASNVAAWYNLAVCRLEKGQSRDALADLDKVLCLQPAHAAALVNRGNAQRRLGETDSALADYTAALAIDPTSLPALLSRAGLLSSQGKTAEALADLTPLDDHADPGIALLRAEIHTAREEHERAIACLTSALQQAPDDPRLLNNLAHLLATSPVEGLRNSTRAIVAARKACTLEETPGRLDTLATALAAARQWEEAIRTQEKAMEEAPRAEHEAMRARLYSYIAARASASGVVER